MSPARFLLATAALATLLWLLHPTSSSTLMRAQDAVEVTFMAPGGPISNAIGDAVRVFEEESQAAHRRDPTQPAYRIVSGQDATRDPTGDPTRFVISLAGGMPPDVISFDRFAIGEWAARGAFYPLDAYLARDLANSHPDAIRREEYFPAAWNEVLVADPRQGGEAHLYGIPVGADTRALYYNKDLLVRAGYVDARGEARPPQTWEELAAMAVKLTERDAAGRITRLGFAPSYGNSWLYLYAWLNGAEFLSPDGRRATLNDPRAVEALTWIKGVYDQLGGAREVYGFQSSYQGNALDPFLTGQVAMKIDRAFDVSAILAQFGQNLHYGIAQPPVPAARLAEGKGTLTWMGGYCYAVPSTSRQKEGAWALIRFLASDRAQHIISESERQTLESQGRVYVPLQIANRRRNAQLLDEYVFQRPGIDPKVVAAMRAFTEGMDQARYRPVTPVGQLLWNQHVEATENAVFGNATPQAALDSGNAIVQRELDQVLAPLTGSPVGWRAYFAGYVLLILVAAAGAYFRDTRRGGAAGGPLDRAQWSGGWLSALPWIVGFLTFTGGPILFSLVISFCHYDVLNPARYAGLDNYAAIFSRDPLFWKAVGNTLYMVAGVPLGLALGLGIALLLNREIRGVAAWRALFYLPAIVPIVASSVLWFWILNPHVGLLNGLLASVGIHGPNWLQDERTSKVSLILMGLWTTGGGTVVWLAGLKGISPTYYEAAILDGAGPVRRFFHLTLPLLSPYIFFNLIVSLIGTFQIFTQAFIMTQGGPVNSTLFYAYHLFNHAFRYLNMGYAAALAWLLFLVLMGLTWLQMWLSRRWVHYEGE